MGPAVGGRPTRMPLGGRSWKRPLAWSFGRASRPTVQKAGQAPTGACHSCERGRGTAGGNPQQAGLPEAVQQLVGHDVRGGCRGNVRRSPPGGFSMVVAVDHTKSIGNGPLCDVQLGRQSTSEPIAQLPHDVCTARPRSSMEPLDQPIAQPALAARWPIIARSTCCRRPSTRAGSIGMNLYGRSRACTSRAATRPAMSIITAGIEARQCVGSRACMTKGATWNVSIGTAGSGKCRSCRRWCRRPRLGCCLSLRHRAAQPIRVHLALAVHRRRLVFGVRARRSPACSAALEVAEGGHRKASKLGIADRVEAMVSADGPSQDGDSVAWRRPACTPKCLCGGVHVSPHLPARGPVHPVGSQKSLLAGALAGTRRGLKRGGKLLGVARPQPKLLELRAGGVDCLLPLGPPPGGARPESSPMPKR